MLKAALCTPPPSYVVVNEDYLGKIASMATLAEQDFMNPILREKEVQVSRISTCLARNGVVSCDNSYRIEGTSATNNGKHPRALYSYLNGTMEKTAYSDGVSGFSFVLYRVGEDIHSFLIEDTYAQSILVRMIARDSRIPGFELVHTEDYPRQMGVYAVTFD